MTAFVATVSLYMGRVGLDHGRLDQVADIGRTITILLVLYVFAVGVLNFWAKRSRSRIIRRFVVSLTPRLFGLLFAGLVATATPAAAQTNLQGGSGPAATGNRVDTSSHPPVMEVVIPPSDAHTSLPWMTAEGPADSSSAVPGPEGPTGHTVGERDVGPRTGDPGSSFDSGSATSSGEPDTSPSAETASTSGTLADQGDTHVVAVGEHMWSIAESWLVSAGSPGPSDSEISQYWLRLIDANRADLLDPDNPDLIMPGQKLTLPPAATNPG